MNNQMQRIEELVKKLSQTKNKELKELFVQFKDQPVILEELLSEIVGEIIDKENPYKYDVATPEQFINDNYYFGKLTQTMYPKLKQDFITLHSDNLIKEAVMTGCVGLRSLICESNGNLITLEDKLGNKDPVIVVKQNQLELSQIDGARYSGPKRCHRLTLANGMSNILTPDHQVQVWRDRNITWIQTKDIVEGDLVICPRYIKTNPDKNNNITKEEARLFAYVLTNGSYDAYRLRYDSANHETTKDFLHCVNSVGFDGWLSPKGKMLEFHSYNSKTSGLIEYIQSNLGIRKIIRVPKRVATANKEIVASFINAVIAAEGCVYYPEKTKKTPPVIKLSMINELFIREVQLLLLRFGIHCRIKHLRQFDKRKNLERFIWELSITGISNFRKFIKYIGYPLGKEEKTYLIEAYCNNRNDNTNTDVIPFTGQDLYHYMRNNGIKNIHKTRWKTLSSNIHNISYRMLSEWLDEYGDTHYGKLLKERFPDHISYIRVVKNEVLDGLHETGDIGAYNGNRFIANGMSVHNSIGWGKTFFIALCLSYEIYKLSCFKEPQLSLKISKSSKIVVMNISITEKQAKEALFFEVKNMIGESPYFAENFMFDQKKKTDELIFPNNIWFQHGTSTQSSTIGLNIYAAALDEANFFRVIKQSKKSIDASGEYDQALTLYYSLLRRQESRFLKDGVRPGKLYLGSSKQYPNDFTEKRIKAARESNLSTTYVMDYSRWAVNREAYSKDEFQVEIGGMNRRSRVLEGNETDIMGDVISVPMDFYESFKKDIDNAIRDIAGMSLYSINPFIGDKEYIKKMFKDDLPRVFSVDAATLSPKLEYLIKEKIVPHIIPNPKAPRYVHMDIGLKHDRFGFAMGHIESMTTIEREEENPNEPNKKVKVKLPKIRFDMFLKIYPEKEFGEVELSRVRDLLFKLISFGYRIKYVSADGFQSADMKQILQRRNIEFDYISLDRSTEPYETARSALYDERVIAPTFKDLEEELNTLEKNYVLNKVDHPIRGSKDIADAWGGVIYNAHIKMKHYEEPLLIAPIQNGISDFEIVEDYDKTVEQFEKWVKGDLYTNEKKRYSKNVREIGSDDVGDDGSGKAIHNPTSDNCESK